MDTKECEQAYDWAITPDKNKHEYKNDLAGCC